MAATVVLVGHAITPLKDFAGFAWLHTATWALGVPLLALVSGRFSTADPLTGRHARQLVQTVFIPYAAFSLLHTLQIWILRDTVHFFVVNPVPTLWFLLSLLFWRAALPYLAALRFPFTLSVVAAVVVGLVEEVGFSYSASQTVTFLPFFLLGWRIGQGGWHLRAMERIPRSVAAVGTVVPFVGIGLLGDAVDRAWLAMSRPYIRDGLEFTQGVPVRLLALAWGVGAAVCMLRLVPRGRVPFITHLGSGGFYIYLIHPLILRQLYHVDFFSRIDTTAKALLFLVACLAAAALLASPPVRFLARPFVQPRASSLLFRRPTDPPATPPAGRPGP
ncbi:hypothetical protein FNQ90_22750, partial [Streptomyces alkaliphilus]